ncbi:MAG: hypothetical protein HON90_07395, partial [Halobacteriovoraceae bacterium]|nr:hypothetical protein [Halobacteriovoraceae bacterium]
MTAKKIRNIGCIGVHQEMLDQLTTFFQDVDTKFFTYEVNLYTNTDDFLQSMQVETSFDIVLVDFCNEENEVEHMLEFLNIIKGYPPTKKIPFIGVFENVEALNKNAALFGVGLNYAHILGNDVRQLFSNMYYVSYEDESLTRNYAIAKGFSLECPAQSLAFISELSLTTMSVDNDLLFDNQDEIHATFNLFEDFTPTTFPIIESFKKGKTYNTMYNDCLSIPFSSGWDNDEDSLQEDTFKTWLGNNTENFSKRNTNILFYTNELSVVKTAYDLLQNNPFIYVTARD